MLTRLPRLRALAFAACVAGVVPVAASSTVATAAPTASAAAVKYTSCSVSNVKYPGSGYYTSLKKYRLGCSSARSNMKAHYTCRTKHGRSGHCSRVRGYRCSETRKSIPTEYNARVTCSKKKSGKTYKFVYTYQQNT